MAFSTACSGPDPGAITFAERPSQGSGEPQGSSGTSGTTGTPQDGGDTTPADPVFGATPFAYEDPGVQANDADEAHAGTVEGKNCFDGCHIGGGVAQDKPWVFAGTIYAAATEGATVPKAEIKIVGPNGEEVGNTYTDANGNFWLEKAGTTIPAGSRVGVRKEGGRTMLMATPLQPEDGACSANRANCHGTNITGRVYAL